MPPPNGSHVVGLGALVEEALGAEALGLRVEVLAHVHEHDARVHLHARRQLASPPSVRGFVSVRSAPSITGRSRSVSLTTASR